MQELKLRLGRFNIDLNSSKKIVHQLSQESDVRIFNRSVIEMDSLKRKISSELETKMAQLSDKLGDFSLEEETINLELKELELLILKGLTEIDLCTSRYEGLEDKEPIVFLTKLKELILNIKTQNVKSYFSKIKTCLLEERLIRSSILRIEESRGSLDSFLSISTQTTNSSPYTVSSSSTLTIPSFRSYERLSSLSSSPSTNIES